MRFISLYLLLFSAVICINCSEDPSTPQPDSTDDPADLSAHLDNGVVDISIGDETTTDLGEDATLIPDLENELAEDTTITADLPDSAQEIGHDISTDESAHSDSNLPDIETDLEIPDDLISLDISTDSETAEETYEISIGPITVPPYYENTKCLEVVLDNDEPIFVNQLENSITGSSHHMIVYTLDTSPGITEPQNCDPFIATTGISDVVPIALTQKAEDTIQLPSGVAYQFEPHQSIWLELHYINLTSEEVEVMGRSIFHTTPQDLVENEAGVAIIANLDVYIPPGGEVTLGPEYRSLPSSHNDVNFFAIAGHTHQWGTDVWVATTTGPGGLDTPVYDLPEFDWSEPEYVYYDEPFNVPEGGGFRFSCSWHNYSDDAITFGFSALDEMCLFYGYYYPNRGLLALF